MSFRLVCLGSLLAVSITSCSAPDPAAVTPGGPRLRSGTGIGPGPGGDDGGNPGGTDGGSRDGGGGDGGGDGGGGSLFALVTTPPTVPGTPASQRGPHVAGGAGPILGNATQCLDCHVAGGSAAGQQFAFGGRAVTPMAGTPTANIQVCVFNPGNLLVGCAASGSDGFFWAPLGAQTVVAGAQTGARLQTAGTPRMMGGTLGAGAAGGSCNQAACHGGAQGRVYVP